MKKTNENTGENVEKKKNLLAKFKKKGRINVYLLAAGGILILAFVAAMILSKTFPDTTIGISIVRDINIALISTIATLLGLYVTAFIFLNDSLKNRVKEDPQIKEAVNDILYGYRRNMRFLAIGTIATIVAQIVLNVVLGRVQTTDASIENLRLMLDSHLWRLFIGFSVITLFFISWIILASKDIMNSDYLIAQQSKRNMDSHKKVLVGLHDAIKRKPEPNAGDGSAPDTANAGASDKDIMSMSGNEIMHTFATRPYSFHLAHENVAKNAANALREESDDADKESYVIRLGKIIRFIEAIVGRICDNNIDKSIMNGNLLTESMRSGFEYLYCSASPNTVLDVRDEKRFLDHLKYQIITSKRFKNLPFDNKEVEEAFGRARNEFKKMAFVDLSDESYQGAVHELLTMLTSEERDDTKTANQSNYIATYKKQIKGIIGEFFNGFEHLVGYRDALVRFDQYGARVKEKSGWKIWPFSRKRLQVEAKPDEDEEKILHYAEVVKRVLIDRFTSFVKINDLNLGNSTMDKGWFNYSELSASNFTHSSFRFARLENAILRNCDLSTCSFILADASDSDFSGSNFNYSDLTGMDLTDCNLNNTQMNSIVLRDARIDNYYWGLVMLFRGNDNESISKELGDRQKWQNEIRKRAQKNGSEKKDEAIKRAFTELRRGEAIRKDILDAIADRDVADHMKALAESCKLTEGETDTHINTENGCVLEKSYDAITKHIEDFLNYRKYNKVSREIYKKIPQARINEKLNQKGNNMRETLFGKVYFGEASLKSASVNDVLMKDIDFSFVPISDASFRNSDLSGAEMYYTVAQSVMFHKTNLNKMDAYLSDFSKSNFREATLVGATLTDCNFRSCNFSEALLLNTLIVNTKEPPNFDTTDPDNGGPDNGGPDGGPDGGSDKTVYSPIYLKYFLKKAEDDPNEVQKLLEKVVEEADVEDNGKTVRQKVTELDAGRSFTECEFSKAIANEMLVFNTNMTRARFDEASVRSSLFYNTLMHWCICKETNFSNSIFIGVSFHQASCSDTNFSRAKFFASEFSNANLNRSSFISARMEKVIFDETNLADCKFSSAQISNCSFNKCNFQKVIFDDSTVFTNVIFSGIDFSETIGLDQVTFNNCIFDGANIAYDEELNLSAPLKSTPVSVEKEAKSAGVQEKKLYSSRKVIDNR